MTVDAPSATPAPAAAVSAILAAALTGVWMAAAAPANALEQPEIKDVFGRSLVGETLRLVDWEGYIANPAVEVAIEPPEDASLPASATIRADHPRLYFDCRRVASDGCSSSVGSDGPKTGFVFLNADRQSFYVSIFPDRRGRNERATLTIEINDGFESVTTEIPVRILDQDRRGQRLTFDIDLDFRRDDDGLDWFNDPERRQIAEQAARDWEYFLDGRHLDAVPAGKEWTVVHSTTAGLHRDETRTYGNPRPYRGFRLYPYGITCFARGTPCGDADLRSTGEPSSAAADQVQHEDGAIVRPVLRRFGRVEIEIAGNHDRNGWRIETNDARWHELNNQNVNDLYSIFRHEVGHALAFNGAYEGFPLNGSLTTPAIRQYLGSRQPVAITGGDHFDGAIDPASLHGAFGNEYDGRVPARRWLVTKLDLLLLEAVGYRLRDTEPVTEFAITTGALPRGVKDGAYRAEIHAKGGIPVYNWHAARLPEGLRIDPFTGEVSGSPGESGRFEVRLRACDQTLACAVREYRLAIETQAESCADRCAASRDQCVRDPDTSRQMCAQLFRICIDESCGAQP